MSAEETIIPRKIHYVWFGRGEKSELFYKCYASWKKYMPDYEIIEWNEDNFDIDIVPYVRQAYDKKSMPLLPIMRGSGFCIGTEEFIWIRMLN